MHTLLVIGHVLTVVVVVGPAMIAPWAGKRALRDRDGDRVHATGRRVMGLNALTLVAAVFGALATVTGDRYDLTDPWLVIASTLYLVALVNGVAVIPSVLARIGKDLQDGGGVLDTEVLERCRGRLLALAGLNLVCYSAVIVLMTWRP